MDNGRLIGVSFFNAVTGFVSLRYSDRINYSLVTGVFFLNPSALLSSVIANDNDIKFLDDSNERMRDNGKTTIRRVTA